nr:uncharacterized protein LOC129035548 isoform X2 [Pongo pygmaeus]
MRVLVVEKLREEKTSRTVSNRPQARRSSINATTITLRLPPEKWERQRLESACWEAGREAGRASASEKSAAAASGAGRIDPQPWVAQGCAHLPDPSVL